MNNQNILNIINENIIDILEKTAFMFPAPLDMSSGVSLDDMEFVLTKLDFIGNNTGEIKMILPVEFCIELSANLLGEEIENVNPEENNYDSAKELLNIVSGQIITGLYGTEVLYQLVNLEVNAISKDEIYEMLEVSEYHGCMVDDYPIFTIFTLQEVKTDEHKSISR
ncbi:MAG: hypothetical protein ABIJ45_11795 [Candidatus Zixiibacteriota bacterium]